MFQWTVQKTSFWMTVKSFSAFSMLSYFITWLLFACFWNLKMKFTKLPIFKEYSRHSPQNPVILWELKDPESPTFYWSSPRRSVGSQGHRYLQKDNCSRHPWGRGRVIHCHYYVQLNRADQSHSYRSWIFTYEHRVSNISWPAALSDLTELLNIAFREFSAFQNCQQLHTNYGKALSVLCSPLRKRWLQFAVDF